MGKVRRRSKREGGGGKEGREKVWVVELKVSRREGKKEE